MLTIILTFHITIQVVHCLSLLYTVTPSWVHQHHHVIDNVDTYSSTTMLRLRNQTCNSTHSIDMSATRKHTNLHLSLTFRNANWLYHSLKILTFIHWLLTSHTANKLLPHHTPVTTLQLFTLRALSSSRLPSTIISTSFRLSLIIIRRSSLLLIFSIIHSTTLVHMQSQIFELSNKFQLFHSHFFLGSHGIVNDQLSIEI